MTWSDKRISKLTKLWHDGLSGTQIADELGGVTRSAVIAKAHRLGLTGKKSVTTSAAQPGHWGSRNRFINSFLKARKETAPESPQKAKEADEVIPGSSERLRQTHGRSTFLSEREKRLRGISSRECSRAMPEPSTELTRDDVLYLERYIEQSLQSA